MNTREYYQVRTGDMRQFCGLRRTYLAEGKAGGVEAVDLWNMAGLAATVLPGRGMDIARMSYRGIPLSYLAKPGITAPGYYDAAGTGWLRSFFGGMLTTCGLANAGPPNEYTDPVNGPVHLGQHGRISNTAAEDVGVFQGWTEGEEGETYRLSVTGRLREACLFAENYTLRRTVTTELAAKCLRLDDVVTNDSDLAQPVMLLYHINIGYPMLDEGARVYISAGDSAPITAAISPEAKKHPDGYRVMDPPICGYTEALYFHHLRGSGLRSSHGPRPGRATACLVNDRLGLAFYIRFDPAQLPFLTEWKMMGTSEYVLGLEPGNCVPVGQQRAKEEGTLEMLEPWGEKRVSIEFGVADGDAEIARLLAEAGEESAKP